MTSSKELLDELQTELAQATTDYGQWSDRLTRKKDIGRADAALIARFG